MIRPQLILAALGAHLTVMLVNHRNRGSRISSDVIDIDAARYHLRDIIVP